MAPELSGALFGYRAYRRHPARVTNENFGTFSFYGSFRASYGVPVVLYLWCWDLKHNST